MPPPIAIRPEGVARVARVARVGESGEGGREEGREEKMDWWRDGWKME